jgi:rSAM/selenodomain-associated transferase 2
MHVDVIIPVLDEESGIADQIDSVSSVDGIHEVFIVDGGSRDGTWNVIARDSRVRALKAMRGRASQMNAGADAARGDVLLFLHADVRLPRDAVHWVRRALADPRVVGGAFRTWTVDDGATRTLGPLLHLADVRSRYARLPYGDQALFVRASVFRRLGGFPSQPLMEDLELAQRLRRVGRLRTVPASVRVSGRRFLARPIYYTFLVNVFPLLYRFGVPPSVLAGLYGNPR